MNLNGKKILIGITGAIAAYKVLDLIRMYKKALADVKVVLTPNALEFVTVKTLETLSGNPVYVEQFKKDANTIHISLETWADIFVLAPVSANTISKIANGICDNLLTSVSCAILGAKTPILLAPSMNTNMWENEAVIKNLEKLKKSGCTIQDPETGFLACGVEGKGRLANVSDIFDKTCEIFKANQFLFGKKIIITAGGTKEMIDPVRYISNSSSGKMGVALADVAYEFGADVELISTFDIKKDYKVTKVNSADDILNELKQKFSSYDCLIMAAAIADYKIKKYNVNKISSNIENLNLELTKNPDILKEISKLKTENQKVVGFCLSTENLEQNAIRKLKEKNCDYIVANEANVALGTDTTEVLVFDKNLNKQKIELNTKRNVARKILELIYD